MKKEQGLPARSVAGFTVLELMVTILILSVLLGLGIPGFSRWLPNYRLKNAARDIYSNLQYAKMTAVKDRAGCGVLFDVANKKYLVISSGTNRTWESTSGVRAGDDVTLKTVNFSEYGSDVGYGHGSATAGADGGPFDNNVTFPEDGVVFDPRGIILTPATAAGSTGGYVYAQNNKNSAFGVGVLGGGVIVLRRWQGSAWQ